MNGSYLGMSYLAWAWVLWAGLAGTFATILLYRLLIRMRPQDELFIPPDEMRRSLAHLRDVNRCAAGFGIAAAVLFAFNVAVFLFER